MKGDAQKLLAGEPGKNIKHGHEHLSEKDGHRGEKEKHDRGGGHH